jgi:putative transposase
MVKSWRSSAGIFIDVFQVPTDIRRIIYTTNTAEAVHRQFRKLMKTKKEFPNDNSWLKLLSIGLSNAINKWTMPTRNRNLTLFQMTLVDVAIEL